MPDPINTVAFLRWAVAAARGANDPSIIAGRDAVAAWLDGDGRGRVSFDEATGLKLLVGQHSRASRMARDRHDDLILKFAARFFPADTFAAARARSVHASLARYGRGEWKREKQLSDNPHPENTERWFAWEIFAAAAIASPSRGDMPLSPSRISALLRS